MHILYRVAHEKPARRLVDQRGRRSRTLYSKLNKCKCEVINGERRCWKWSPCTSMHFCTRCSILSYTRCNSAVSILRIPLLYTIVLVIIIIIIIIIIFITCMHGIYNYIPQTTPVSTVHNVTAVLYLQSVLHVMLFRLWNVYCTLHQHFPQYTWAVPNMTVFCSSLISCFPGILLWYCLIVRWFQYTTYFMGEITLHVAQTVNTEEL